MLRSARLIILLVLVALAAGACTGPGGRVAGDSTPAADDQTPVSDAGASPTDTSAPVTVVFAAQDFERQVYQPLIDEFNRQNPDVQVRFIPYSEILGSGGMINADTMIRQLMTGADTAVSLFVRPEEVAAGLLRDLAPLIESDPGFDRDDYYAGALEQPGQSGVYALPQTLRVELLNYNKDLWAARGLPQPQPTWTWADLIGAAEQLARKRGDQIEVYGLADFEGVRRALAGELAAAGATTRFADAANAQLDDPSVAAALERVAALVASGALYRPTQAGGGPLDFDAYQKLIDTGGAAIWPADSSVQRITIGDGPTPEVPQKPFAVGTTIMPQVPSRGPGLRYIMSSGTQHPEAAWRWLAFLSKQNVASPFRGPGSPSEVPARKSLAEQSGYWDRLDAETKAAVEAALARLTAPVAESFDPLVLDALEHAAGTVIEGTPTQRALADAQTALTEQVAQAALAPTGTPAGPLTVATPAPEVAPPGAKPLTFNALGLDPGAIKQLAREFNQQHPELFVQVEQPGFEGRPLRFADIASTSDCFAWFGPPESEEITATLDLQPLFDADSTFTIDDYPALLLAPFRQGSALHGLPDQVSLRTLIYNPDAFAVAGLEVPAAGWTVDQFLNAAQRLTGGDEKDKRYGFASLATSAQDLLFFLRMNGLSAARGSGDSIAPNFSDLQVAQAVRAYIDLLKKNSPHEQLSGYTRNLAIGDVFPLIQEGRVGMWFDYGAGGLGLVMINVGDGNQPQAKQAIAPPPFGSRGASPDDVRATGLYIAAGSQNAAGCWEWLKFLSGVASRFGSSFPARTSVATSQAFLAQAKPGAAEVYAAYGDLLARPDAAVSTDRLDYFWLFRAVDRALAGEDLDRELAEAQSLTERYLACVRTGTTPPECATQVDPTYDGIGVRN
jgi:ABC-type glycerol-3-phosphate transport system substrate-binding protein